jgi:hypothetical protein
MILLCFQKNQTGCFYNEDDQTSYRKKDLGFWCAWYSDVESD